MRCHALQIRSALGDARQGAGGIGSLHIPATAGGTVELNPCGHAFLLERDQRQLGGQRGSAGVFKIELAGETAAPQGLRGFERSAITSRGILCIGAALAGAEYDSS